MTIRRMDQPILVAGGYGKVGRVAARQLAKMGSEVVIAGRSSDQAKAVANALGQRQTHLDLDDPASIAAAVAMAGPVLNCTGGSGTDLAAAAIDAGSDYVDITATWPVLSALAEFDHRAKSTGSRVVLSVGLAPGLTNLLAAAVPDPGPAGRLDITVQLGAGEVHGQAAIEWTISQLGQPFVTPDGVAERNFVGGVTVDRRTDTVTAYPFNFSDQHSLSQTLGVGSVRTRMCLDSRAMTAMMALISATPARRVGMRWPRQVGWLLRQSAKLPGLTENWQLDVTGTDNEGNITGHRSARGTSEATATGVIAATTVLHLERTSDITGGVRHLDQLPDLETLSDALSQTECIGIDGPSSSGAIDRK